MIAWAAVERDQEFEVARRKAASEVEARLKAKTAELTVLQKRMQNASKNRHGDEAVFAEVCANIYAKDKNLLQNYYDAWKPLSAGHLLSMRDVDDQEEIVRRKDMVQTLVSAGQQMDDFIYNMEDNMRTELLNKGVPKASAEKAVKGLRAGMSGSIGRFNQMRELRIRWAQDEMAGLDLLNTN